MTVFRIGQKVVCINDQHWMSFDVHLVLRTPDYWGFETPVAGNVYTVRQIVERTYGICMMLEEIDNRGVTGNPNEVGFHPRRFRPVHTIATDAKIFQRIADHIDPIIRAEEFERSFDEIEAALNNFDLP